jgi:hypothetical protein
MLITRDIPTLTYRSPTAHLPLTNGGSNPSSSVYIMSNYIIDKLSKIKPVNLRDTAVIGHLSLTPNLNCCSMMFSTSRIRASHPRDNLR